MSQKSHLIDGRCSRISERLLDVGDERPRLHPPTILRQSDQQVLANNRTRRLYLLRTIPVKSSLSAPRARG